MKNILIILLSLIGIQSFGQNVRYDTIKDSLGTTQSKLVNNGSAGVNPGSGNYLNRPAFPFNLTGDFMFDRDSARLVIDVGGKYLKILTSADLLGLGGSPPFDANTAILMDHTDNTKTLKFNLASVSTSTARTLTVPNTSLTVAGIDISQTFAGTQTFATTKTTTTITNGQYKAIGHLVSSLATTYTALLTDNVLGVDATAANFTITLPSSASGSGLLSSGDPHGIEYVIYKEDNSAHTITVVVNNTGTETINGATSFTITTQYQAVHVICSTGGAINWFKY